MFDLINSRFLTDGIDKDRWQSLIEEYKLLLKPRCWLQMVEVLWKFHSPSDQALSSLDEWSKAYMNALTLMQKDPDITESRLEWFARRAGFEQVHKNTRRVMVGNWRPGSYLVRVGCERSSADWCPEDDDDDEDVSVIRYVHDMLESVALIPFTRSLGWDMERCMRVVGAAQAELRTPNADISFEL